MSETAAWAAAPESLDRLGMSVPGGLLPDKHLDPAGTQDDDQQDVKHKDDACRGP
ncbi:hypothetical protein GCM10020370_48330 [Paenibacillus hodogayensis]